MKKQNEENEVVGGLAPDGFDEWSTQFKNSLDRSSSGIPANVTASLKARYQTVVAHFNPAYVEAEKHATSLQIKYRRASLAVFLLAFLAVIIVSAQSIFHLNHWIIVGEVIAISTILILFYQGARQEWHYNWMESRLEAEWLRNGVFVAFLSGGAYPGIARHWACRWVSDTPSVARVQEKWDKLPDLGPLDTSGLELLKDFMANAWLKDQRVYHEAKSKKENSTHNRITLLGEVMFWGTFVAAIIHLVPHSIYHSLHLPDEPIVRTLTLLAIGLPTMGAALTGIRSHFEFKKIASRSAMMADHLAVMEKEVEKIETMEELRNLVQETETLMLQENSDWYFTIGMHHIEKG